MTAEIAILNKTGVALAADSAVTVSVDGGVKVFPSANKIFALSKFHPVGVMIYGASEMLDIPWETTIKTFRCPAVTSFEIYGNLGGRLRFIQSKTKESRIDPENTAAIVPFAQSEMVTMFMEEVDPSYQRTVDDAVYTAIEATARSLIYSTDEDADDETQATVVANVVERVMKTLAETLTSARWRHFVNPVLSIVGALPKVELASMAESLVNLTSMKRHISSFTETVGGPIDVALISKGDGFVWIKRKHYFDKDLNYHFFANYFRGGTADES